MSDRFTAALFLGTGDSLFERHVYRSAEEKNLYIDRQSGHPVKFGAFWRITISYHQQKLDVNMDQAENVEIAPGPKIASQAGLRLRDFEVNSGHHEQTTTGDAHVEGEA